MKTLSHTGINVNIFTALKLNKFSSLNNKKIFFKILGQKSLNYHRDRVLFDK